MNLLNVVGVTARRAALLMGWRTLTCSTAIGPSATAEYSGKETGHRPVATKSACLIDIGEALKCTHERNGTKIEIFKPFGEAFELMKKILFQPFRFDEVAGDRVCPRFWRIIRRISFQFPDKLEPQTTGVLSHQRLGFRCRSTAALASATRYSSALPWVLFVALILIFSWLSARGRFIFTDCIVKNHGAIVAPWHEFRKEANSFFPFRDVVYVSVYARRWIIGSGSVCIAETETQSIHRVSRSPNNFGCRVCRADRVLVCAAWIVIAHFMVRSCIDAAAAPLKHSKVSCLCSDDIPVNLSFIVCFFIVLAIAVAIVGCVVVCATCCIAAIHMSAP